MGSDHVYMIISVVGSSWRFCIFALGCGKPLVFPRAAGRAELVSLSARDTRERAALLLSGCRVRFFTSFSPSFCQGQEDFPRPLQLVSSRVQTAGISFLAVPAPQARILPVAAEGTGQEEPSLFEALFTFLSR